MIPLYKLFAVTARLFTKPLLNIIKKRHKSNAAIKDTWLERFFVWVGNKEYRIDLWLNRKLLSIDDDNDMFIKPLAREAAIERGIEFFYEVVVYGLLILITILELLKVQRDNDEKSKKSAENIKRLENNHSRAVQDLQDQIDSVRQLLAEMQKQAALHFEIKETVCAMNKRLELMERIEAQKELKAICAPKEQSQTAKTQPITTLIEMHQNEPETASEEPKSTQNVDSVNGPSNN